MWSTLYREVETNGALPASDAVEKDIRSLAKTSAQADALSNTYASIAREIRGLPRGEAIQRLAEMELGDRTNETKVARQNEVEGNLVKSLAASVAALGSCPSGGTPINTTVDPIPLFEHWRQATAATLYGAYKTMSVGYQSCNAISLSPLNASGADIQGITVTGTYPDGIGLTRDISSASQVFTTNPFYSGRASPPTGCFGATTSPIIYNYGGKPYTSAGVMDLTKNAGTGSSTLGIDCSGFVASATLAGGLRLKQNVSSKAAQSTGVSASMLANPAGNGLTCFNRLASTATEDLKSGDVVANTGHTIMIDQAGADPFGIAGAKTAADCDAVSYSKFNFTVIQSSASKGGIGINRYRAIDFLAGYTSMRTGLEAYATSFCRVRLGLDSPSTLTNTSLAVVIRNQGGPACTDTRIGLVGESCLQSCTPVAPSTL
jgi:hypothetical protein